MAANTKAALRATLSQVVSYDGGNQVGAVSNALANDIFRAHSDKPVIDGSAGNVTLTAEQSGGTVFIGGGARVVILPAMAAGLNYSIVSTSAHNHVISSSAAKLNGNFLSHNNDNSDGTTSESKANSKTRVTLRNGQIGEAINCVTDGTEWYLSVPGGFHGNPIVV